jgi:hypothetical protein
MSVGLQGKDLGYDVFPVEADGAKGNLAYLQDNLTQIGSNQRALIDVGAENDIQMGQQLILYRRVREDLPVQILGNCIFTDVKRETSTIKVLSCRDTIRKDSLITERPSRQALSLN